MIGKTKTVISLFIVLLWFSPMSANETTDSLGTIPTTASDMDKLEIPQELSEALYENDTSNSLGHAQQELRLARSSKQKKFEAKANILIGMSFENLDGFATALEYYFEALKIYEKMHNREGIASVLNRIGGIYWILDDFQNAITHFERSLRLYEDLKHSAGVAQNLNSIGLIFWKKAEYEKAIDYFLRTIRISESNGDSVMVARALNNLGIVYEDKKEYETALFYYKRALELNERIGRIKGVTENQNNIGSVYTYLKLYDRAKTYLDRAQIAAKQVNSQYLLQDNYHLFYRLYRDIGDFQRSLAYFQLQTEVKSSIFSVKTRTRANELQAIYMMKKMDAKLKSHRQRSFFIIVIFSSLLAFSILISIQYRLKYHALEHLVRKNVEIMKYEKKLNHYEKKAKVTDLAAQRTGSRPDHDKYARSALSEEQKLHLIQDIMALMENDKLYLNPELTIEKLSEHLQINRSYVSQVINEKIHKSFTRFINEYRIREARHRLSEDHARMYTIESIARSCGFHSTNAFNKAFKRSTGVTPSYFIKSIKKNSDRSPLL